MRLAPEGTSRMVSGPASDRPEGRPHRATYGVGAGFATGTQPGIVRQVFIRPFP